MSRSKSKTTEIDLSGVKPDISCEQEESYLIGIKDYKGQKCPRSSVVINGIEFPEFSETVETSGGVTSRSRIRGVVKRLLHSEVEQTISKMRNKIFRRNRLLVTGPRYRPQAEDIPVSCFLYIHKLEGVTPANDSGSDDDRAQGGRVSGDLISAESAARARVDDASIRERNARAKSFGQSVKG